MSVTKVDGKPLDPPVTITLRGKVSLQPGKEYRLVGYQSGEFVGAPDWTSGPGKPMSQQSFQFHPFFVAVGGAEANP